MSNLKGAQQKSRNPNARAKAATVRSRSDNSPIMPNRTATKANGSIRDTEHAIMAVFDSTRTGSFLHIVYFDILSAAYGYGARKSVAAKPVRVG